MFSSSALPALVTAAGECAGVRFLEFFAANIRNPHTRRTYSRAVGDFSAWCEVAGRAVDRALIGLMVYILRAHPRGARDAGRGRVHPQPAAMGAAARKGGKRHAMPCQSPGSRKT